MVRSRGLHRNLFDNLDIEALKRGYSPGVIGQEADAFQIQVGKNLRSQADFAMDSALVLGHRGQTTLAMKCQEGLLADFFRREAFGGLVQVDKCSAIFFRNNLQRSLQRLIAIASRRTEDVAEEAVCVHTDQDG